MPPPRLRRLRKRRRPKFLSWTTACHRGYVATWEIIDNKLYLRDLEGVIARDGNANYATAAVYAAAVDGAGQPGYYMVGPDPVVPLNLAGDGYDMPEACRPAAHTSI